MSRNHSNPPRGPSPSSGPAPVQALPPAWQWWVDEAIPTWVKSRYSPQESWKSKPFGKEDALFFFKGIEELSELFTDERPKNIPAYFNHPKFRSSYLLYFLPLQAAKFLTLFELYPQAFEAALAHGRRTGVLRIADLGAGPATASIAVLLRLLATPLAPGEQLPAVELDLFDTNASILEDGKGLAEQIGSHFSKLRGKLTVRTHVAPWWEAPRALSAPTSLVVLGHVLNESSGPNRSVPQQEASWQRLWSEMLSSERVQGGGVLMVEPAARMSSQTLSRLRDQVIEAGLIEPRASAIWGPCLHAGRCPLAEGRDWCHFSVASRIPGQWFREFSQGLGSERQWLKFSYLWLASREAPAPLPAPGLRRVVSDPLTTSGLGKGPSRPGSAGPATVLICEPEQPARYPVSERQLLWRGDVVNVGKK